MDSCEAGSSGHAERIDLGWGGSEVCPGGAEVLPTVQKLLPAPGSCRQIQQDPAHPAQGWTS